MLKALYPHEYVDSVFDMITTSSTIWATEG